MENSFRNLAERFRDMEKWRRGMKSGHRLVAERRRDPEKCRRFPEK
jgi:hypothetical protein